MASKEQQKLLLNLAREAIKIYPDQYKLNEKEIPSELKEKRGVFVSIYFNKQLRGCIGYILPCKSIYESVIENAINSAYHDDRFPPLKREDIKDIKIEISILTKPKKLDYKDPSDLLKKLDKQEGVILGKNQQSATFLPQVWEKIPKKEQFLTQLCFKAGLDGGEWREGDLEIQTYRVEKFSD